MLFNEPTVENIADKIVNILDQNELLDKLRILIKFLYEKAELYSNKRIKNHILLEVMKVNWI